MRTRGPLSELERFVETALVVDPPTEEEVKEEDEEEVLVELELLP